MKHLMTLAALFVSSLAIAQDYPEYPFPYNPDGNADGYIGLTDLLDLLVVYGQEYPGSFYGDSAVAVLDMGKMPHFMCAREAESAGRNWRILTQRDASVFGLAVAELGQLNYENTGGGAYEFWTIDVQGYFHFDRFYFGEDDLSVNFEGCENCPENLRISPIPNVYTSQESSYPRRCVILSQARPQIEYDYIDASIGSIRQIVSDSLSNGWNLTGGISNRGGSTGYARQAIWRFAQ